MKKEFKVLIALLLAFCLLTTRAVNAASTCDDETLLRLRSEAANVSVDYEGGFRDSGIKAAGSDDLNYKENYIKTIFLNITDNIYIEVTSDAFSGSKTFHYADTEDGMAYVERVGNKIFELENLVIKVFSKNADCPGELLRTINYKSPKYNIYHKAEFCSENDKYYCNKYIDFDIDLETEELEIIAVNNLDDLYLEEEKTNYTIYILIGVAVIVIGVGSIVLIKRKRSRVL